jgi:integrase
MRGSIRKRGASSYEIQLELERVNGKRQRRFIAIKGTYKDAQKELTRLLGAADDGTLPDPTRMTIADYLRSYLDNALSLSPKTLERYRELAERQIIPHLGDVKLQKFVRDTPEKRQEPGPFLFADAIKKAWPCSNNLQK